MTRPKNKGLDYLRRSTDKQEISLPRQLEWALSAARQHGVALDATPADLAQMQALRLHSHKALRLDDGISGSDLNRPGFLALNHDAIADKSISHVFFYKRDRFARPDDAMQAAQIEKQLLFAGITVIHSDGVTLPLRRGEQNILRDMELLLAYYQSGEELRKHAERMLGAQQSLAHGGYRVGGNAPYGFVRVLVNAEGIVLEELPPGKVVRQSGCHVRVVPKDPVKIANWLQILKWKHLGWGVKRIAQALNDRGIPSPDAGRIRTDQGVKHRVTGKWSPNTVADLCRNATILGIQEYGKRSEGKLRRLGQDGPRLLDEEKDLTPSGKIRIIENDPSLRISKQVAEPQFDPERWQNIQQQTQERGQNQRGIPRAKDPARYPLACRLVDLTDGCGSVLYGRMVSQRAVYSCGRYMRTAGAECDSNQVDAEAILRFTLKTLAQFLDQNGRRDKLRQQLLQRAQREAHGSFVDHATTELARLHSRRDDLHTQRATIEYRMARERDDGLYAALTRQFKEVEANLVNVEDTIRKQLSAVKKVEDVSPEARVEAALAILDEVKKITSNAMARSKINPILQRLNLRIGLTFIKAIKGKKRAVRMLLGGRMTFGDGVLPVPLFGKDNVDAGQPAHEYSSGKLDDCEVRGKGREEESFTDLGACPGSAEDGGNRSPHRPSKSRPEGISITKGNRADRI